MGTVSKCRSAVSMNYSKEGDVLPHDYAAAFFAELLPIISSAAKEDDSISFNEAILLAQQIQKKVKNHDYTRDSLLTLIKVEFLSSMGVGDLRRIIGESPFCRFPHEDTGYMVFKSVSNNPPALRDNYGDENYTGIQHPFEDAVNQESPVVKTPPTKPSVQKKRRIRNLNDIDKEINLVLEDVYDSIILSRSRIMDVEKCYEWQLLLTEAEYSIIKDSIRDIASIPPSSLLSDKALRLIAIYIAEYYKREYSGKGVNAFVAINKEWNRSSIDFDRLHIPSYKKNNVAHLYSLYVNGGLPIYSITTELGANNNGSALVRFLSGIFDDDEIERELAFASLPAKAKDALSNNTALRESIGNCGSIYKQIESLIKDEPVFSDEDLADKEKPFELFLKFVRDAKIEVEKKKSKIEYDVWYDPSGGDISIRPVVRFSSKKDEEQAFSVSRARLAQWGVPIEQQPDCFSLTFKKGGRDINLTDHFRNGISQVCFVHNPADEYIEFAGRSVFYLPILSSNHSLLSWSQLLLSGLTVSYTDNKGHFFDVSERILIASECSYFVLYSDDGLSWSSRRGNNSHRYAAILFNTSTCCPSSGIFTKLSNDVGWATFEYSLRVSLKGKDITLYNGQGRVSAEPKKVCAHGIIRNNQVIVPDDNLFEYEFNGELKKVFLVECGRIEFDLFRSDNSEQITTDLYTFEKIADGSIIPINNDHIVEPGLHTFLVSFDNRHFSSIDCYALNKQASVIMDTHANSIDFRSFENLNTIRCLDETIRVFQGRCTIPSISEDRDCLGFSLEDPEGGHLYINTYYPFDQILFRANSGLYIKACGRGKNALPIVYNGRCEMINVSSTTVQTREPVSERSSRIYAYLLETNFDVIQASGESGTKSGSVSFVAYSQDFQPYGKAREYLALKGKNARENAAQYSFFFFDLNDNQVVQINPIIKEYDGMQDVILDLDSFSNHGILFQSLKQDECAQRYFRPIYVPEKGVDNKIPHTTARKNQKQNKISQYALQEAYTSKQALFAFETASKHSLYFSTFDILLSMISERDIDNGNEIAYRLARFLKTYFSHCSNNNRDPDYRALWRLADEFVFDWLVLPKQIYIEVKIKMDDLLQLLKQKPDISSEDEKAFGIFLCRYDDFQTSLSSRCRKPADSVYSAITGPNSMFIKDNPEPYFKNRCRILDKMRSERFLDIICKLK